MIKRTITTLLLTLNLIACFAQNYLPKSNGEVVEHTYYTLSYREEHEQSEWVFYTLTEQNLETNVTRSDRFKTDNKVSTTSASATSYEKSGYDRGHLCPAASMSFNDVAMNESFYMSNMSPQAPSFNRGGWKSLEELVRSWAANDSILYVVTGPILNAVSGTIGSERVSIPTTFYKIVYSPKRREMIGFVMPNQKIDNGLESYATSVDDIESRTGIDFFASHNDRLAREESEVNRDKWSFTAESYAKGSKAATATEPTQCLGTAASTGERCKNSTTNSNGYCHLHQSQATK